MLVTFCLGDAVLIGSANVATTHGGRPKSAYCCGSLVQLKPRPIRAALSMLALQWKGNPGGIIFAAADSTLLSNRKTTASSSCGGSTGYSDSGLLLRLVV
jgi:hypothetical protein